LPSATSAASVAFKLRASSYRSSSTAASLRSRTPCGKRVARAREGEGGAVGGNGIPVATPARHAGKPARRT
jgi:hypothetical protein